MTDTFIERINKQLTRIENRQLTIIDLLIQIKDQLPIDWGKLWENELRQINDAE